VIVVSDTSPIANLAAIGRLALLQSLYGRIVIPEAVYSEIIAGGEDAGATQLPALDWIETRKVAGEALVNLLRIELDAGEAETIALALESKADLLLLDERRGREAAARLGLTFIGLLGVLVEAKHRAVIPIVKPLLDELIVRAGFWVTRDLYSRVLSAVDE
jgi:uncharacterized protein